MRIDPKIDCAHAPVVALGGREFFVPALSLRQARIVVPGLLKLLPRLNAIQTRIGAGDPLGAALLDKDDLDLMIDVVHAGLTRAYPDFSRDDLLDLEAGFADLAGALAVIAKQTGLFAQAETSTPGE
ncbi:hypothetical protein CCR94_01100 [Rhodoblastus sphagnicola]|uniref:Uncharacterized protein n=1 Tax=Rhodoblastus sphagnicola TaxID=333368 RepID=A0A2S6NG97_9HYPH|nr:hypothetical protein [Rhodoblastus sphagnicola]MBB4200690.1 hypothetical protein [Rhodoblastus sphagnicola]PPQ33636.1 hypothetical protein CCR94_01100 [Rhodoblastus sphagnicola]